MRSKAPEQGGLRLFPRAWPRRLGAHDKLNVVDRQGFRHGIELFNRGEFFEAHEVLEDVWRAAPAEQKLFLQGMIQVAVGLHHYRSGNRAGAQSVLARAARNLARPPADRAGVDVEALREAALRWSEALARGEPVPELPLIHLRSS